MNDEKTTHRIAFYAGEPGPMALHDEEVPAAPTNPNENARKLGAILDAAEALFGGSGSIRLSRNRVEGPWALIESTDHGTLVIPIGNETDPLDALIAALGKHRDHCDRMNDQATAAIRAYHAGVPDAENPEPYDGADEVKALKARVAALEAARRPDPHEIACGVARAISMAKTRNHHT